MTTLSTPGGNSVCSATRRPRRVAFHGVSGAGLRMTVLPVASACPSLFNVTSSGKFHGTMAPTTPTGSFQIWRVLVAPRRSTAVGISVRQGNSSMSLIGYANAPSRGMSSWLAWVVMRGQPTSRISSSRIASRSFSSASWSWARHSLRRSRLVDQSDSSKARRAASMARCISAFDASATGPSTSSVAGLTLSKVRPESASTSSPSTSILTSWSAPAVMAHPLSLRCFSPSGNLVIKMCNKHNRPCRRAPSRSSRRTRTPAGRWAGPSQSVKAGGRVPVASTSVPNWRVRTLPAPSSWSSTTTRL